MIFLHWQTFELMIFKFETDFCTKKNNAYWTPSKRSFTWDFEIDLICRNYEIVFSLPHKNNLVYKRFCRDLKSMWNFEFSVTRNIVVGLYILKAVVIMGCISCVFRYISVFSILFHFLWRYFASFRVFRELAVPHSRLMQSFHRNYK